MNTAAETSWLAEGSYARKPQQKNKTDQFSCLASPNSIASRDSGGFPVQDLRKDFL